MLCLSRNLLHRATGQKPDHLASRTGIEQIAHQDALVAGVTYPIVPFSRQSHRRRSVPIYLYRGNGNGPPRDQSIRCQPAAVRRNRPARSNDSSASPRRSFLTARQSRSLLA